MNINIRTYSTKFTGWGYIMGYGCSTVIYVTTMVTGCRNSIPSCTRTTIEPLTPSGSVPDSVDKNNNEGKD